MVQASNLQLGHCLQCSVRTGKWSSTKGKGKKRATAGSKHSNNKGQAGRVQLGDNRGQQGHSRRGVRTRRGGRGGRGAGQQKARLQACELLHPVASAAALTCRRSDGR